MSDQHHSDSDESISFFVDLKAHIRDTVSISSVDSEPIAARNARLGEDDAVGFSDDEEGEEESGPKASGSTKPKEGYTADALGVDVKASAADVAEEDRKVPVERLSEAPVATVSSLSAAQKTVVAEGCDEAVALDMGTHLCLADGTLVGVVASTFGPVRRAFYILVSPLSEEVMSTLQGEEKEICLHMDLGHQTMIFDPMTQCDVANGTDASYINDEELPEHVRPDFSDDEKELSWKRQRRLKRDRSESISSDDVPEEIEWAHIELEDPASSSAPPVRPTGAGTSHARSPGVTGSLITPQWLQK